MNRCREPPAFAGITGLVTGLLIRRHGPLLLADADSPDGIPLREVNGDRSSWNRIHGTRYLRVDDFPLFLRTVHGPEQVGEVLGVDRRHLPDWFARGLACSNSVWKALFLIAAPT